MAHYWYGITSRIFRAARALIQQPESSHEIEPCQDDLLPLLSTASRRLQYGAQQQQSSEKQSNRPLIARPMDATHHQHSHSLAAILLNNAAVEGRQIRRQSLVYAIYKSSYDVVHTKRHTPIADQNDSSSEDSNDDDEEDEDEMDQWHTPLKAKPANKFIRTLALRMVRLTKHFWSRALLLYLLPTLIVVLWAAIPFPTMPQTSTIVSGTERAPQVKDFWFFLCIYYSTYLIASLLFVTMIFQVYALSWWPSRIGAFVSHAAVWLFAMFLGICAYLLGFANSVITWAIITSFAMMVPPAVAFYKIRKKRKVRYRNSVINEAEWLLMGASLRTWVTTSFNQYKWFCVALGLAYTSYLLCEAIAHQYLITLPHTNWQNLLFSNAFMAVVYGLDYIAGTVVEDKIGWRPLQETISAYHVALYFIFYRNLFVKLVSLEQFLTMQVVSSLWVLIYYVVSGSYAYYRIQVTYFGQRRSYEQYLRNLGRVFFVRNVTENTTIMTFLGWFAVLRFGANAASYPYFTFSRLDDNNNQVAIFKLTLMATLYVWVAEQACAALIRYIYRHLYYHDITKEAIRDFRRYPEVLPCLLFTIIHVSQDMLLALFDFRFA